MTPHVGVEHSAMIVSRRTVLTGSATVAAASMAARSAGAQDRQRLGIVGMVKPVRRPGTLEEIVPFLPPGVGMIPVYVGITQGTENEFEAVLPAYEKEVALLAAQRCDIMSVEGGPVFLVAGLARETAMVKAWEKTYGIPIFTPPQNQVNALHALGAKSFVGATYFPNDQNAVYATYFKAAGFDVLSLDGIPGYTFDQVQDIPGERVAEYIRASVAQHPQAQAIYMLGSGWHVSDIIGPLEKELGIPVVHPVIARAWEIQKRLHLHLPIPGYGKLLAELP
jgi:maleate isomerase